MIVDQMTPLEIGTTIKDRRKALLLTQARLAELAGCSKPFIIATELGKESLRLDKLMSVLNVLGLSLEAVPQKRDQTL